MNTWDGGSPAVQADDFKNSLSLNAYLRLGYFLNYCSPPALRTFYGPRSDIQHATTQELKQTAIHLIRNSIDKRLDTDKIQAVPLSGGLDSRLILALLMEQVPAAKVTTFTYGLPGSFDFEIGAQVARFYGVEHNPLSLHECPYDTESLVLKAKAFDLQTEVYHGAPVTKLVERYGNTRVWSGFLGDYLAGSRMPHSPAPTKPLAAYRFLEKEGRKTSNLRLDVLAHKQYVSLLDYPDNATGTTFSIEECWDFSNRQAKLIAPSVLHKGLCFETPFSDPEVLAFFTNLPRVHRKNCSLYKGMILEYFPEMSRIPLKSHYGLGLKTGKLPYACAHAGNILRKKFPSKRPNAVRNRMLNYLDFKTSIQSRKDLRDSMRENLNDLKKRNIVNWLDLDEIWNTHQNNHADLSNQLIFLASLEIILKAGRKPEDLL
ncbi:MAG: asparagine synthase C-terminal domain-containing protein [Verrucomicrobia bacterium]|nr:asparagine synthase C-terminal domain-containing protein [Verrucomicrobiota bacterium]